MAQFDVEKVIRCIPDFHGNADDVQNFIDIADIFHSKIGKGEETFVKQFLAVIRLKLKDDARERAVDIMADSWKEVQENLNSIYQCKTTWSEILHMSKKLVENKNESLEDYRRKADKINRLIKLKGGNEAADEVLKENFIGGLQSTSLLQFAGRVEDCSYEELIETIMEKGKSIERIFENYRENEE